MLQDVSLGLEDGTTLIVGRNNCGKTSIAEVFRRLLSDRTPSFRLEDFSLGSHEQFWAAFNALQNSTSRADVSTMLPVVLAPWTFPTTSMRQISDLSASVSLTSIRIVPVHASSSTSRPSANID
ncbi:MULTISPECIES: ATP-binding protein [unclassified Pseudomonas]|uniref:ATP-binding protein n=1 Tax=unclassified Pseudomonas TaxID=196821 RepID=UPI0021C72A6D|nr:MULTISPECIES: ATP-binding protein [unclassified Pseudomonas]MCU1733139.1 ATP-binding protein [Pseudomonas sp. 20P_3.2_Bac4]MCU1744240.1 ATP-binding protein [Pseudomonas sp. 20P_3.2_Bac5]